VSGNENLMGEVAKSLMLKSQVENHPDVVDVGAIFASWQELRARASKIIDDNEDAIYKKATALSAHLIQKRAKPDNPKDEERDARRRLVCIRWQSIIEKVLRRKYRSLCYLRAFLGRCLRHIEMFKSKVKVVVRERIIAECRVFVSTIDSLAATMREYGRVTVIRPIHSVIVDEAGCVLEPCIALLMRHAPENLVLVGDPRQLRPFSSVSSDNPFYRDHDRSLMERAEQAGLPLFMLREQ